MAIMPAPTPAVFWRRASNHASRSSGWSAGIRPAGKPPIVGPGSAFCGEQRFGTSNSTALTLSAAAVRQYDSSRAIEPGDCGRSSVTKSTRSPSDSQFCMNVDRKRSGPTQRSRSFMLGCRSARKSACGRGPRFRFKYGLREGLVFLPVDPRIATKPSPPVVFNDNGLLFAFQLVEVAIGFSQVSVGDVVSAAGNLRAEGFHHVDRAGGGCLPDVGQLMDERVHVLIDVVPGSEVDHVHGGERAVAVDPIDHVGRYGRHRELDPLERYGPSEHLPGLFDLLRIQRTVAAEYFHDHGQSQA